MSAPASHAARISVAVKQPGITGTPRSWRRRNHFGPEHRRHDELRAGVRRALRGVRIQERAGAQQEVGRDRGRQLGDQLDGPRHRHGDFERPDAAFEERVHDAAHGPGVLHADDGHHAKLLDDGSELRCAIV
jgi:hypothetical protein